MTTKTPSGMRYRSGSWSSSIATPGSELGLKGKKDHVAQTYAGQPRKPDPVVTRRGTIGGLTESPEKTRLPHGRCRACWRMLQTRSATRQYLRMTAHLTYDRRVGAFMRHARHAVQPIKGTVTT